MSDNRNLKYGDPGFTSGMPGTSYADAAMYDAGNALKSGAKKVADFTSQGPESATSGALKDAYSQTINSYKKDGTAAALGTAARGLLAGTVATADDTLGALYDEGVRAFRGLTGQQQQERETVPPIQRAMSGQFDAPTNPFTGTSTGTGNKNGGTSGGATAIESVETTTAPPPQRDTATYPSGTTAQLYTDPREAQAALNAVGKGQGALYSPESGMMFRTPEGGGQGDGQGSIYRNPYGRTALEEYALANKIRQETIDSQRGAGIVIPDQPSQLDGINAERARLSAVLANTNPSSRRNIEERNAAYRGLQGLNQLGGDLTSLENTGVRAGSAERIAQGRNSTALEDAYLGYQGITERNRLTEQRNQAYAQSLQQRGVANRTDALQTLLSDYATEVADAQQFGDVDEAMLGEIEARWGGIARALGMADEFASVMETDDKNYANGGMVIGFANGGAVPEAGALGSLGSTTPMPPAPAVMQQYQNYADSARQMGLTVVPFDKFSELQGGSQQSIPSFADGGQVPDASGKMVIDPDPNAPTDSIPAMIDGQQPAALDSGEFVIPKDVVMFYGTDKLDKMIEKARNPEGNNGNQSQRPDAFALQPGSIA